MIPQFDHGWRSPCRSRTFSTFRAQRTTHPFNIGPSPPRLPKEEQEIFERLQRSVTGPTNTLKHSTSISPNITTGPPNTDADYTAHKNALSASAAKDARPSDASTSSNTSGFDQGSHLDLRKPVEPEFEGDVNPRTGEVGGPKNEPLRWGATGDWSYKGRATDF